MEKECGSSLKELISYKKGEKNGLKLILLSEFNKKDKIKDTSISVTSMKDNKNHGYSLFYMDRRLGSIGYYTNGKLNGIRFSFDNDFYPSVLEIYENDKLNGMSIFFIDEGEIRGKFMNRDGKRYDESNTFENGQIAYSEIEEQEVKYRVFYNSKGEILLKWPKDSDFCKARFYENGKETKIPTLIDSGEFDKIYKEVKDSESNELIERHNTN